METNGKKNRLAQEKSPYLLQHADNPVDWRPWGEEAFELARKTDRPVFLSVGYATCHWCHVMAHESFEDSQVADLLNRDFVSVKVDREERPDVDSVYMSACQMLTGRGGWPLSVFMTPDGKPFFAGTYFPKTPRAGMPGFMEICNQISNLWNNDREKLFDAAHKLTEALSANALAGGGPGGLDPEAPKKAQVMMERTFDAVYGGFGQAPKFPSPHQLLLLLHRYFQDNRKNSHALEMVEKTLQAWRNGGIFDQLAFGIHRYSVDEKWLVPHFEKMLYDQALVSMAMVEAFRATQNPFYAQSAREIFSFVSSEMTHSSGGFYSAQDADSEGEEGTFYVWTPGEIKQVLGPDLAKAAADYWGVTEAGNFEGKNILHVRQTMAGFAQSRGLDATQFEKDMESARVRLLEARAQRIRPITDDKILASWNGLMAAALAMGAQALEEKQYLDRAVGCVEFVFSRMMDSDGRLLRSYREGRARVPAFLEDYACLAWACLEIYRASWDHHWLVRARDLVESMLEIFSGPDTAALYDSGRDNEKLITRTQDLYDGAMPSGNSVAVLVMARLARLLGDANLEQRARSLVEAHSGRVGEYPMGFSLFLCGVMSLEGREVVIAGDPKQGETRAMLSFLNRRHLPDLAVLVRPPGPPGEEVSTLAPFAAQMEAKEAETRAYLCQGRSCQQPVDNLEDLKTLLARGENRGR